MNDATALAVPLCALGGMLAGYLFVNLETARGSRVVTARENRQVVNVKAILVGGPPPYVEDEGGSGRIRGRKILETDPVAQVDSTSQQSLAWAERRSGSERPNCGPSMRVEANEVLLYDVPGGSSSCVSPCDLDSREDVERPGRVRASNGLNLDVGGLCFMKRILSAPVGFAQVSRLFSGGVGGIYGGVRTPPHRSALRPHLEESIQAGDLAVVPRVPRQLRCFEGRLSAQCRRMGLVQSSDAGYPSSYQKADREAKNISVMRGLPLPFLYVSCLLLLALALRLYANCIDDKGVIDWWRIAVWIVCFVGSQVSGYLILVHFWG
jgi:hypothetical protein